MNRKIFATILVALWLTTGVSFADRQLDRSEILSILKTLTAEPHKTWIPAGTILATHEEYKAAPIKEPNGISPKTGSSGEYRMPTNVILRFDGEKFYWQIDIASHADLVKPNMANDVVIGQFDPNANSRRVFAWDGQKYSTYFRPGNTAIIKDAARMGIAPVVNGPLTAGFIPWGYGNYSYEKLSAATSEAIEAAVGGGSQIQLTLNHPNGSQMSFVMAPDKNYAVLSHSVRKPDGLITLNNYGNFLQVGGRLIPTTIMLEEYKNSITPPNLVASDLWNLTSVNTDALAEDSFKIDYETDALVEYHNSITAKPVIYRYSKASPSSNGIDTDSLLIDKFELDSAPAAQSQNCAVAAIKYAAAKLGKNVADQQFLQLIPPAGGNTSLYAVKQFAQGVGLYCRAVRTDLQTLKTLAGCQALLHIPGKNHYVVLGNIDEKYVRIIDLTSRKFFDRFSIGEFGEDWSQGTALLISDRPIDVQGTLMDIDDATLQTIVGAGGFSCSKRLQEYDVFYCSAPIGGWDCGGAYDEYLERWGCQSAPSGTCGMSTMPKYQETICIVDAYDPINCTVTGEWKVFYMKACM